MAFAMPRKFATVPLPDGDTFFGLGRDALREYARQAASSQGVRVSYRRHD